MTPTIDAIGLVVSDLAASLAFYRDLGLEIPDVAESEHHVEASLGNGMRLMWDTVTVATMVDPTRTAPTGSPRMSLAIRCDTPAEVDRVYAEMTARGHHGHREPWNALWGQRYAILHDPDDNCVDLYAPLDPETT